MIAGVIQARVGSERCKNKMLRDFGGTNLVSHALEKFSVKTDMFKLYFAAFEEDLLRVGSQYKCEIIKRDEASAKGERIELVMNYVAQIKEDFILFINPCCPFLSLKTVETAVQRFIDTKAVSMTSVQKTHTWYYFVDGRPINFLDPTNLNTKSSEPLYAVAHAFHIFKKERFLENHYFWNHKELDPYFFEISEREAIDIDSEFEFFLAESIFLREKNKLV